MNGTPPVRLRRATEADARLLWAWRNDADSRRASFDQAPVPFERHAAWLAETLASGDRALFVACVGDRPVAAARLDIVGHDATVSIMVAPEARGRGLGTATLNALCHAAFDELRLGRLWAEIKADNAASRAAFARAGFAIVREGPHCTMERTSRLRVVGVVQARLGSQRLPGKVLRDLAGRPMLAWLVDRLRAAAEVETVLVATSIEPRDDAIAVYCAERDVRCVRGSEVDLVSRLRLAAASVAAAAIVRVTADCPFVDPLVVDGLVRHWRTHGRAADVVTNNDPPSYPHGLDAELLPTATLVRLDEEIAEPYYREWFPYWWRRHRDRYRIENVAWSEDLTHHRWTVDYAEDLAFADRVFRALAASRGALFQMQDVLDFLAAHPEVVAINAAYAHR